MTEKSKTEPGVSDDRFAERRARVLAALERGVMLLPGTGHRPGAGSGEHTARFDSEVFYLTGCTDPEAIVVLAPEAEDGPFILFVPSKDLEAERWSGRRLGPDEARDRFGADAAYPLDEMDRRIEELLKGCRHLFYRLGAGEGTDALVRGALAFARGRGARTGTGPRLLEDPGTLLDPMRVRKDPDEIQRMRAAAVVTVEAFRAAIAAVGPGVGEWEIEAAMGAAFRTAGATGPAFDTIVGSGANACVLHYVSNDRRIEAGDLVLIDAGARRDMYCADITRTVPASGAYSEPQRAVYEIVARARSAAIGAAVVGSTVGDLHAAAVREITTGLVDLGVLQGSVADLEASRAYRPFFPHQTSHWLGLDVHDVGDYAKEGDAVVLEAGMVFTVEPGLYFHPEVVDDGVPESLVGLGVRIEDDVLVTPDGPEVLTGALPVDPDEVCGRTE